MKSGQDIFGRYYPILNLIGIYIVISDNYTSKSNLFKKVFPLEKCKPMLIY